MRANYRIDIIDAGGNQVEEYQDFVIVNLNDGWVVKENYIYYEDTIEPGEEIPGPIESIEYLEEFANTRDWDVYIPVLIECAEDVDEIRWPNQDIERINIKDWINYDATWTQSVMIKMS